MEAAPAHGLQEDVTASLCASAVVFVSWKSCGEEELAQIEKVTAEDIQRFARDMLCPERMSVCLVGETRSAGQKLLRKYEQLG